MARTDVPVQTAGVQSLGVTDVTYTAGDATNHHSFTNDGRTRLIVKNGGVAPINVTVNIPARRATFGLTNTKVVAVTNAKEALLGPFPPEVFNQSDGTVTFDLSADTSVNVATISHPIAGVAKV